MQNFINWFEIPATDFERATAFYRDIFQVQIDETEMAGMRMGMLPHGDGVSGAIVAGEGNVPSTEGPLLYLNGGNDLNGVLDRIEGAGGKVILPKTEISPEIGHFAIFIDTEGNKLALHSRG